jgi:hypothetical protein
MQPNLDLSTGLGFGKIELERLDRNYWPAMTAGYTSEKFFYTANSLTKFDRKQNTRLWPFIFTGITRSPPRFE